VSQARILGRGRLYRGGQIYRQSKYKNTMQNNGQLPPTAILAFFGTQLGLYKDAHVDPDALPRVLEVLERR
jgi:hypothetical protein